MAQPTSEARPAHCRAILQRKECFEPLLSAVSRTLDHFAFRLIEQTMPQRMPLAAKPSMEDVKESVGRPVSGKTIGTDYLCRELLKLGLTEEVCHHEVPPQHLAHDVESGSITPGMKIHYQGDIQETGSARVRQLPRYFA